MRRSASLPVAQKRVLEQLARVQFATPQQLARLANLQTSHTSVAIKELMNAGLLDGALQARPMILFLTTAGGRLLGVPMPSGRRRASWSVMAHACHLTAAAEMLAGQHVGFQFLSRHVLLTQGFNPGHGEHGAIDASGTAWFVLLDDYMMGSDRISRSWTRRHAPNRRYWPDHTGKAWCDVVQRFLVVCTDGDHAERHRQWVLKESLPADVAVIGTLWK